MNTSRFGKLRNYEKIYFEKGLYGFESKQNWTIVDPEDNTLILWLQSLDDEKIAFPIVKGSSLGEKNNHIYLMTIPSDMTQMTINKKAPLIINDNLGEQILLHEEDLSVQEPIYQKLRQIIFNN